MICTKIDYEVNEEQKKVIIKSLPEAEVKIYPTMKYYDVSQSQVNPFTPDDVEKIRLESSVSSLFWALLFKVEASTLRCNSALTFFCIFSTSSGVNGFT